MNLTLRWIAAVLALALAAWLWFGSVPSQGSAATSEQQAAAPALSASLELDALSSEVGEATVSPTAAQRETVVSRGSSAADSNAAPLLELATVRVRVLRKETLEPLVGHRITAFPEGASSAWIGRPSGGASARLGESAATDSRGVAELIVPAGAPHRVATLDHWGAVPELDTPALAANQTVEVELVIPDDPDLRMFVRVVDGPSGEALADATAKFSGPGGGSITPVGDGLFFLEVRSWSRGQLSIEAPPRLDAKLTPCFGHSTRERAFEVALQSPATLEVVVLDSNGPVPATRVVVRWGTRSSSGVVVAGNGRWSAPGSAGDNTDEEGLVRFDALTAGLALRVDSPSSNGRAGAPVEVTLAPYEVRRIELRLAPGAQIGGRVLDHSGAPIQGLRLTCDLAARYDASDLLSNFPTTALETKTDADGRFTFGGLRVDAFTLKAASLATLPQSGFAAQSKSAWVVEPLRVELHREGETRDVLLRAAQGEWISGTVLDSHGEPVSTLVCAYDPARVRAASTTSSADGAFRLGPLAPADYAVVALSREHRGGASPDVAAHTGATEVRLRLSPCGVLRVRVTTASGELADANVSFIHLASTREYRTTTHNALAELATAPFGTYAVIADAEGARSAVRTNIEVAADSNPALVELRLVESARLTLRPRDALSAFAYSISVDGAPLRPSVTRLGRTETISLPAGYIEVRELGATTGVRTLQLAPGETRELVLGDG